MSTSDRDPDRARGRPPFLCPVVRAANTPAARVVELYQGERVDIPQHDHERALVSLLLAGEYSERLGAWRLEHRPLAVACHPAGMAHRDEVGAGLRMLVIELAPDGPLRHFPGLAARPPQLVDSTVALAAAWGLRAELHRVDSTCDASCEGLVLDLLSELDRESRPRHAARPRWLDDVVEQLRGGYRQSVSFAALAAEAGVHVGHLWRVFRRAEGCSPSAYLQRLRCRHVMRRLAEPAAESRLADLALEAGFADQSHLNRVFKRTIGMPPGDFRSSLRDSASRLRGNP